ncbi:phage tail assembly chaperone [Bacillus sp. JJ1474]|uniref:phage tail assembly chaperone n=1 Tax=Bacillus sp. JJ1474 TaxID=3122955 RepID=UPI002FFF0D7F
MSKKKLTITDLIEQKEKLTKSKKKTRELYIDQLGGTITIEAPERSLVLDSIDLSNDNSYEGNPDDFLVYNIVVEPNLKDPELQKIYECKEPVDIVSKIFDVGTITGIAKEAMNLAGYNSKVTPVDDLKN